MKNKFKMPEHFYFPMHMLGTAETGIVTAFIDIEKTNPVELAKLATMVFVEQLAAVQA